MSIQISSIAQYIILPNIWKMDRKVNLYKIACFVNLFSAFTLLLIFLYRMIPYYFIKAGSVFSISKNIWPLMIIFLAVITYAVNFFYGIKLVSRFYKGRDSIKLYNRVRVVFFILEILVILPYSYVLYQSAIKFSLAPFRFLRDLDFVILFLSYLCLFSGYFSSLTRIFLTRYILKRTQLQLRSDIDLIGEQ